MQGNFSDGDMCIPRKVHSGNYTAVPSSPVVTRIDDLLINSNSTFLVVLVAVLIAIRSYHTKYKKQTFRISEMSTFPAKAIVMVIKKKAHRIFTY